MAIREHKVSYSNGPQIMVAGLSLPEMGYGRGAFVRVTDPSEDPGNPPWEYVVANDETATLTNRDPPPPEWIQPGAQIRIEVRAAKVRSRRLATQFDNAYPDSLSKRLEWWSHALGIDHVRLLRMMGMTEQEAKQEEFSCWDDILKEKKWEENAWWVEGKLHQLLVLFDYDWKALAERLHHSPDSQKKEPSRVERRTGEVVHLQYMPADDPAEVLLNQVARGGPESFTALLSYLSSEL